jgi:L-arabonate dehydrase
VVHLIAIARRLRIPLQLQDFDRISRRVPCVTDVKPSGRFLMEDLFYAGGLPAVLREILPHLHGDALTVNGRSLADNVSDAPCHNREVVRPAASPLQTEGGIAVLRGNLAPDGAVIKQSAASPHLLQHRGPAYVFENYEQLKHEVESDDLPVDENTVLVLKNGGPKGAPGFPEWGQLPIPKRLLQRGVKDLVRLSDARMSGTSFGTVVLHIAPESAVGGPLALVRTGDEISLDVPGRTLTLHVPEAELDRRRAHFQPPAAAYVRGYGKLFLDHVLQAPDGCDFDFLLPEPLAEGR